MLLWAALAVAVGGVASLTCEDSLLGLTEVAYVGPESKHVYIGR
jgi:hypothetical protein